jgi:hypothetical protein
MPAASTVVDWTPAINIIFTIVGIVATALAGALATWITVKVNTKLNGSISADQRAALEVAAKSAVTFGLTTGSTQIKNLIAARGWDHIDVKSAALASAGNYMISQFPDTVKAAGFDISSPSAIAATTTALKTTLLSRVFPAVVTEVAASPATPPALATIVPILPIAATTIPASAPPTAGTPSGGQDAPSLDPAPISRGGV